MRYMLLCLMLVGCSNDISRVTNILEAEGCTETRVSGWSFMGEISCDKHDSFNNRFSCNKNGHLVSGYVCSGFLKGMTIRYE